MESEAVVSHGIPFLRLPLPTSASRAASQQSVTVVVRAVNALTQLASPPVTLTTTFRLQPPTPLSPTAALTAVYQPHDSVVVVSVPIHAAADGSVDGVVYTYAMGLAADAANVVPTTCLSPAAIASAADGANGLFTITLAGAVVPGSLHHVTVTAMDSHGLLSVLRTTVLVTTTPPQFHWAGLPHCALVPTASQPCGADCDWSAVCSDAVVNGVSADGTATGTAFVGPQNASAVVVACWQRSLASADTNSGSASGSATAVGNFGFVDAVTPAEALMTRVYLQHWDGGSWLAVDSADVSVAGVSPWSAAWGVTAPMPSRLASGYYRLMMEATDTLGLSSTSMCAQQLVVDTAGPSAAAATVTTPAACVAVVDGVLTTDVHWSGFTSGKCTLCCRRCPITTPLLCCVALPSAHRSVVCERVVPFAVSGTAGLTYEALVTAVTDATSAVQPTAASSLWSAAVTGDAAATLTTSTLASVQDGDLLAVCVRAVGPTGSVSAWACALPFVVVAGDGTGAVALSCVA